MEVLIHVKIYCNKYWKEWSKSEQTVHSHRINYSGLTPPQISAERHGGAQKDKDTPPSLGPSTYIVRHMRHFQEKVLGKPREPSLPQ